MCGTESKEVPECGCVPILPMRIEHAARGKVSRIHRIESEVVDEITSAVERLPIVAHRRQGGAVGCPAWAAELVELVIAELVERLDHASGSKMRLDHHA